MNIRQHNWTKVHIVVTQLDGVSTNITQSQLKHYHYSNSYLCTGTCMCTCVCTWYHFGHVAIHQQLVQLGANNLHAQKSSGIIHRTRKVRQSSLSMQKTTSLTHVSSVPSRFEYGIHNVLSKRVVTEVFVLNSRTGAEICLPFHPPITVR